MRSARGQTMAFAALLFGVVVISVLAMMMLTSLADTGLASHNVEGKINQEISSVRKNSVVTVTLQDRVMRAEEDGSRNLGYDYGGMKAYTLISYYFTEGESIYVGDRRLEKSRVREDLKKYFRYKMEKYYDTGSTKADYYLSLGTDTIVVKEEDDYPKKSWSGVTHRIPLAGGKGIQFGLWTRTEGSIYGDGS
ncbi:MAG: hypothetical protein ABEJ91_02305 [Candidatus Nanohaloarchaea archaeon]